MKLDPAQECPPKPEPKIAVQFAEGSSDASNTSGISSSPSSSPPPNQSNYTMWVLIGGAIAAGAGFVSEVQLSIYSVLIN